MTVPRIYIRNGLQGGNPLANILLVIVGTILIAVSIVVGVVAFLAVSALVLLLASVIGVRAWWAKRRQPNKMSAETDVAADVIEGEFHVVKPRKNS